MKRFIDYSLAFLMAFVILAPTVSFMHAVGAVEATAEASRNIGLKEVYARENGTSSASASIYTVINGEVVTDIHEVKSSSDGSPVSVSLQSSTTIGNNRISTIVASGGNTTATPEDTAERIQTLLKLIQYLQQLLSELHGN